MPDLYFWTVAVLAVFIVALSKSGLVGSLGLVGVPLLSLVITASLRGGFAAGLRIACVPLLSDLPVVLLTTTVVGAMPVALVAALSLAGGLYVVHLGVSTIRDARDAQPPAGGGEPPSGARELLHGVVVNMLNPHAWLFWIAVGVFIAFSPAYGFHTLMAVLCTWLFGLNFLALLAGAFVNNPWTIVPILGASYWTGAMLMGQSDSPVLTWDDLSFTGIYEQMLPYAVPFALGGFTLSVIGALLSYPVAYLLVQRHRASHEPPAAQPLPPPDQVR